MNLWIILLTESPNISLLVFTAAGYLIGGVIVWAALRETDYPDAYATELNPPCPICGEPLLQVAHVGRAAVYGDFCKNIHPITRIPGAP